MLFIGFLLVTVVIKGQQQDLVLSTYDGNSTELKATKSITLKSGFYIPSGKNVRIYIVQDASLIPMPATFPASQNYVLKTVYTMPLDAASTATTAAQKMQDIEYYDGLGRSVQTVSVRASSGYGDIVTHRTYDAFGREDRTYLPYVSGENGAYKTDAITAQAAYYNGGKDGVVVIPKPTSGTTATPSFNRPMYEAAPTNRVLEQGFAGAIWQPSTAGYTGGGHSIRTEYTVNNAVAFTTVATTRLVSNYGVGYDQYGDPVLQLNGVYAAGELSVKISKDENWTSTKGRLGTVEEYIDKQERIVLRRTFNKNGANTEMLSTYYVYDNFGNLCYVLPPGLLPDRTSGAISLDDITKFAYQYRYDKRNMLSQKKLPGSNAWQKMIYNSQGLTVIHQDGQKAADGADYNLFYKYDGQGRLVMKGTQKNGVIPWWETQHAVDGQAFPTHWEERSTATGNLHGYTNRSMPILPTATPVKYEIMEVNYYDSYSGFTPPSHTKPASYSQQVQGLVTAKKERVIGASTETWLWTVYYYDSRGRVQMEWSQHYKGATLSGNYNTLEYSYNFNGQPTQTIQKVYTANALALTVTTKYSYDHRGRLLDTRKQVKDGASAAGAEVLIARNSYNGVGQLMTKSLHGKTDGSFEEAVNYAYNSRGWVTTIGSKLFSQTLRYNDALAGGTAQYNGNISGQEWKRNNAAAGSYQYTYDEINRLVNGTASDGKKELLEYDVMGNIKGLTRDAGAKWVYRYEGSKLLDIKFGTTTYSYTHDPASGNMTRDGRNANDIAYNYLNLPEKITGAKPITYTYTGAGVKLRSVNAGIVRDYVKGTEWKDGSLEIIHTEEGRISKNGSSFIYEYVLKDHLGNSRAGFRVNTNGTVEANLKRDYYPFGMEHADATSITPSPKNNYLYNGKELQDGIGQYDYGARFYDPVIGRWGSVDPLAENHYEHTPYNYVLGNPVRYADFMGLDTISANDNITPVKAGDTRLLENGGSTVASQGEIPVTANVNRHVAYFNEYSNLSGNADEGIAGSMAFGLRAGPIGAVVVGAVALIPILQNLPQNLPPAPGFGDPSKWGYTYRPPSLDPINNPPKGFDPNEPPKDVTKPIRWLLYGKGLYELYDEYNSHMEKLKQTASDNTRVVNPQIKKGNRR